MSTRNLRKLIQAVRAGEDAKSYAALAEAELNEVLLALLPFAFFAKQVDTKPLQGLADDFYEVHPGTPHHAALKFSDCRRAQKALED